MLLHALVQYIERNGIDLKIEDGRLRVTGDQSKLTPEITDAMRAHKPSLAAWCARQAGGIPRAASTDGGQPLSLAQQRLYFLYQYDPAVTSFILPVELELRGGIDVARFRRAIVSAVARHEIYRAVYAVEDGVPRQRVDHARTFEVDVIDVSAFDADAREAAVSGVRTAIAHTPFDLGAELPLRACIVREGDGFHRLVVAMHHIATDDWSIQLFVKDVADAYRDGGELRAEPPAISYLDYAAWQVETHAQGGYDVSRSYWEANLDGIKGVLELPLDAPRPAAQTFNGATVSRRIAAELGGRAAAVARELKTSEFSLYLGAFNLLMAKLTGERDIVVGTDVFGRDHADLQAMAGFFVNQVALRSRIEPSEAVGSYLARLGASTLESLRYQDMPFDKLVDALGIERDTAYPPIFQVKFLYDRAPHRIRLFDDVDVRESHAFPVKSQYDVTLKVVGDEAVFYYNTDLFRADTVALWADLYMAMLERAIAAPATPIAGLLHDALAARLSGLIDGERVDVDASALFAGFDRAVRDTPDAIAVRTVDRSVTYAELDARVARIGARLHAMGVRKGARVAVHLERSVDLVAAIVATMRSGAVFVPIDPSYPREHIDYTLEDSGAGVVITDGALSEGLSEFYGFVLDLDQLPSTAVAAPAWPAIADDDIAYLLYTSGSTGRPKGALVGHGAFSNLCDWYHRFAGIDARSRVLLMIPIGFDASIKNVVCPLVAGGTVVLARAGAFDPDALLDLIEDAGVSLINCAPSAMNAILRVDAVNDYARLASLDMLALGGEALDIAVFAPWLSSAHCRATLANIYGPTECTDISVAYKADRATWLAQTVAPIGHPIQNARACIVDAELQLCPPGVAGELLISGRGVGAGYHGLDEATAQSFIDSAVAGGRAYRTGDICRYDAEGRIVYVGRRDGQIKIRGKRVEINEIVARIAALLPGRKINVQLYAADGLEMLLAFADGGASARTSDEIRRELAQRLPRHMVPAQVLFVDVLPLTPNGKVDHRALAAHFESQRVSRDDSAEPLDDIERAIAAVWEALLGVDGLRKSSDFFALGGDSIFSIQLVAKLREHGMAVSVADIFRYPTIEQLAAFVGGAAVEGAAPVAGDAFASIAPFSQLGDDDRARLPEGLEDAYPVTSLQHGMIFHGLMDAAGTTYHDVFSFELGFDRYDETAFVRAIAAVVARHPVLRTGFDLGRYSAPLQLVRARVEPNIARIDLRDRDDDAQAAEVAATILRLKAEGFDLAGPSLIRFTVLRKAEDCIQLVIDAHHAILDGWSMATLQRQVFETYRALLSGADAPCFDSGASRFADYVALLAREEAEPANRAYWDARAREAGAGRVGEAGPPVIGREHREIRLSDTLAARIDALAAREGVPVRTLLFMAHGHAVRTMIGADRIVTGQTDNGRLETLGSENVLGLFLNVQPQTIDLSGGRWRDLARALQDDEVASRVHRRYPLASILQRHPSLAVDTLFTYTNFRVSQPLTREATLRVREGEMFEELNFPLSFHANGNREDGYSVVLDARLNLTPAHMDALLRAYVDALEAMSADFDGAIPALGHHRLPLFRHGQDGASCALATFGGALDIDALRIAATEVLHRALGIGDGLRLIDLRDDAAFDGVLDEQAGIDVALSETSAADALLAVAAYRRGESQVLALRIAPRLSAASPEVAGDLLARYRLLAGGAAPLSARAAATSPWRPAAAFDRDRAYWRARFADAPFAVELPADRAAQALPTQDIASVDVPIDAASLRAVADACGASREPVLSAAWAALLSRLGGQHDIVFGLSSHALAARTAALRIPLDDAPAASALVARVASIVEDAQAHADLPFAQVVEALHAGRDALPFNTALAFDGAPVPGALDLALTVDGDAARLHYATARFEADTAARIADHLCHLLRAMGEDASRPVATLPLMSADARERLLVAFNATATEAPVDSLVHRGFERQAALQPDAPALVDGDAVLSRAELNRRANRIAHRLVAAGVKPDDRVAICVERGASMVAGLLGILKAGGAYVPLDPAYPAERLAYMLDDSRPVALLTQETLRAALPVRAGLPTLLLDEAVDDGDAGDAAVAHDPDIAGLDGARLAQVIYTSGSTGQPKGVMVEHRNVCELIRTHVRNCDLKPGDRMMQFASYSFDSSVVEIFPTLAAGGTVVLRPAHLVAPDDEFVAFLDRNGVDIADLPTAFWHRWSQDVAEGRFLPPARLRLVVVGGEKVERRHLQQWLHTPGVRCGLLNTYGPTEATVYATAVAFASGETLPAREVPIGRPVGNTRVYVLDAHGEPTPIGVAGELCIAGAQVARGYLGREALSAERFVRDPFAVAGTGDARMYRTGDLARWRADGTLEFVGRNDFQVKIRGYRIELGEIEIALAACAGVRDAVVVAREDAPGDRRLVAYVVVDDAEATPVALRAMLAKTLAEHMLPSAIVRLDALPLTANGKIDRNALPAPDDTASSRAYAEPQGDAEAALAEVWAALLGRARVGRNDHFFELGGHSLIAVQLVTRLRESRGVELSLRDVFARPVLSDMAGALRAAGAAALPPVRPADRAAPLPLSWAQQRLWFLDQLDAAAGAAYHMPAALRLTGRLDRAVLQATLDRLVARHEILRTAFAPGEGEPVQAIAAVDRGFAMDDVDLSQLSPEAREREVQALSSAEVRKPFDLSVGPLIRGRLLRLAADEHVLLLTQHHIISDGWSLGVLVDEVSALYAAFAEGRADPLPPLPVQYADYAVWQREWLRGDALDAQMGYWRDHLTGAPALLELPTDRPRPAVQSYQGRSLRFRLEKPLVDGLRALSRRHGTTMFMTLLAGWSLLLSRLSGHEDVVVGTAVANRRRRELEPLLGFFVNTLALRVDVAGDPTVAELLARARDVMLGAHEHQDVPFEQVVDMLQPARSLGHNPIVQNMLVLQNTPGGALELPGLRLDLIDQPRDETLFDLSLELIEADGGFDGGLEYASDLFDDATIARWADHLRALLQAMVEDDGRRIGALSMLAPEQRRRVLDTFSATPGDAVVDATVPALFQAQVARTPDAPALSHEGVVVSYAELDRRANRVAHRLIALGVQADDRVAVCMPRGIDAVVAVLGVLKSGAGYVPLDPAYPAERLAYLVADSAPRALLTGRALEDAARAFLGEGGGPTLLALDDAAAWQDQPTTDPVVAGLSPSHLAYVIYTSGSTGQPKGVMVEHRNVVNLWAAFERDVFAECPPAARLGLDASLSFDASVQSLVQLLSGRCMVIVPEGIRADGAALVDFLARERIDIFDCTPVQFEALLANGLLAAGAHRPGVMLIGGEALPARAWDAAAASSMRCHNVYGPTECTVDASIARIEAGVAPHIGRPIANARIYVLGRDGEPQPVGVVGEIHVGGAGVARGYLGRPELTAERFVRDPYSTEPGARVYRTGDLGRWRADGTLEYVGRNDFQVKVRGYRIELGEIEARLSSCGDVREAVVLAREDQAGDKRLVAYIAPRDAAKDEALAELLDGQVAQWSDIFDDQGEEEEADFGFDLTGWNSTYTREAIPSEGMREWLDTTLDRIRELQPRRMLEIGVGTGMILCNIAPGCERFVGTDLSVKTVAKINRLVAATPDLGHATVFQSEATDFSRIEGEFDTVVVNSVVQYFPNLGYLETMIASAIARTTPGGRVMIGDVRHYGLMASFHLAVQAFQSPDTLLSAQLRDRAAQKMRGDIELLVDPVWFHALRDRYPRITGVRVLPKIARHENEMSAYRYDVVLTIDGARDEACPVQWRDWGDEGFDAARLQALVDASGEDVVGLRGIAHPWATPYQRAWQRLSAGEEAGGSVATIKAKVAVDIRRGALVADLVDFCRERGYSIDLSWAPNDASGEYCALIGRKGQALAFDWRTLIDPAQSGKPESAFAHDPLEAKWRSALPGRLRERLAAQLPDYMVPSAFMLIDRWPTTANGKLDAQALPAPDRTAVATRAYEPPQGEVEDTIAAIWQELLGLQQVGRHDHFFEVGGHSLLAVQVMARIREAFDVDIHVAELFKSPEVVSLAHAVLVASVGRYADEDVARISDGLDDLSEDELRALLAMEEEESSP